MSSVSSSPTLRPVNRHLCILPHFEENKRTEVGVLLPDDYKPEEAQHVVAKVIDVAADCKPDIRQILLSTPTDRTVIVDKSMIQNIKVRNKTYYVILENYVIGLLGNQQEEG